MSVHDLAKGDDIPRNRWAVRWREGDRNRSRRFRTKKEALAFDAARRLSPETKAEQASKVLTVDAMMRTWFETKQGLRPKTLDAYRLDARECTDAFGDQLAASVQPSDVRVWIARDRGVSLRRRSLVALSQAYRMAMADDLLTRSPCVGIKPPRMIKADPKFLTWEQLCALAVEAGPWAPLVWLLGTTGLRIGEAAGLTVGDIGRTHLRVVRSVTYTDHGVEVGPPKSGKPRDVAVAPFVQGMLPTAGRDPLEWLWVDERGERINVQSWRRYVFQPAADRAGLGRIGPHVLRHTAATLAIDDGAVVTDVQEMLGHANSAITLAVYTHRFARHDDAVAASMQRRMIEASRSLEREQNGNARSTTEHDGTLREPDEAIRKSPSQGVIVASD